MCALVCPYIVRCGEVWVSLELASIHHCLRFRDFGIRQSSDGHPILYKQESDSLNSDGIEESLAPDDSVNQRGRLTHKLVDQGFALCEI